MFKFITLLFILGSSFCLRCTTEIKCQKATTPAYRCVVEHISDTEGDCLFEFNEKSKKFCKTGSMIKRHKISAHVNDVMVSVCTFKSVQERIELRENDLKASQKIKAKKDKIQAIKNLSPLRKPRRRATPPNDQNKKALIPKSKLPSPKKLFPLIQNKAPVLKPNFGMNKQQKVEREYIHVPETVTSCETEIKCQKEKDASYFCVINNIGETKGKCMYAFTDRSRKFCLDGSIQSHYKMRAKSTDNKVSVCVRMVTVLKNGRIRI